LVPAYLLHYLRPLPHSPCSCHGAPPPRDERTGQDFLSLQLLGAVWCIICITAEGPYSQPSKDADRFVLSSPSHPSAPLLSTTTWPSVVRQRVGVNCSYIFAVLRAAHHFRTRLNIVFTNAEVRKLIVDAGTVGRDLLARGTTEARGHLPTL
jgi:hypothetical protein